MNKWVKRSLISVIGIIILAPIGLLAFVSLAVAIRNPFEPPEMTAARYSPRDVVGDLGGVPVTIPRYFADFVEYEGDPSWGEKRTGPVPQRTHQSKLISFGYYTRFPDMADESSPELIENKDSYTSSNTPWISVGIKSGNRYPGDGFLDRSTLARFKNPPTDETYERLPENPFGLTAYALAGIDPQTNKPYREGEYAKDLFIHRDKTGRVTTYITCSNRNVPAPPCRHDFSLEPEIRVEVYLHYRRSQLKNWKEIQNSVKQQILSFRTSENLSGAFTDPLDRR